MTFCYPCNLLKQRCQTQFLESHSPSAPTLIKHLLIKVFRFSYLKTKHRYVGAKLQDCDPTAAEFDNPESDISEGVLTQHHFQLKETYAFWPFIYKTNVFGAQRTETFENVFQIASLSLNTKMQICENDDVMHVYYIFAWFL